MTLNKSQRSNLLLFGLLVILFFTPLGGIIKERVTRLLSFSPSVENIEDRVVVNNFDWKLKGLNTKNYDFNESKGKVVLVNFWATWCPSCRAEKPSIQKLYIDYSGKVDFIFITNEDSQTIKKYLDKYNYNLPIYNQMSNGPSEFNVSSIPATYLLNKKGEIIVHKVGAADWNSEKFRKLLDELIVE
ncbi:TlpA family protein disulfide reductase [Urechidicola croceus]|uniref:Thiol-disulfide oxidoreductase n=1 Tax=Urechidicola croceus TaxID=1850246 RepID=A0A1D8P542_9FLAO|nr:TlpA disulfide reductase family protein [Urechidicola croceus]AOW19703.1 thiol-disulfide oxidoreductase [Urechidicola croceus]